MVLKGNIYTIEITDVSTSGEGIGRAESMVVFVPGTVPGDTADVEIAEVKKNIARGRVAELVRPSADRTEPLCPYFGRCGGCTLQNMTYEAQLRLKEKQLRDKLERIYGGEAPAPEPIIGMDDPWHYRNKGQYAVYAGAALVNKDGSVRNAERPRVGFYDGRERNIVECRSCPIQSPAAERAADALREYIRQTGLSVYDEKTRKGRLRQMIVRTGHASREVMVTLIVNGRKLPKTDLLTDLMFQAIDSLNDEIASEKGGGRTGTGFLCGCGDGRELVRAEESRNQSQFQPHSEGDQYGSGSGLWFQHHYRRIRGPFL